MNIKMWFWLPVLLLLAGCGGSSGGSSGGGSVDPYGLTVARGQVPQEVVVSWHDRDGVEHYELLLAREPLEDPEHYASYDSGELIMDAESPVTLQLEPGTWYFRVAAFADEAEFPISVEVSLFNPVGGLNDTGITPRADEDDADFDCSDELVSEFPRQDGHVGRDADSTLIKLGAGDAGFDYTRICNSGEAAGKGDCPLDPQPGAGDNDWACTRDNVTGLVWEVKVDDPEHLRYSGHAYTWYSNDLPEHDGEVGHVGRDSDCVGLAHCNTQAYTRSVNETGLCGRHDWRLPEINELAGILHMGVTQPAVDEHAFDATGGLFWAGTPSLPLGSTHDAWAAEFDGSSVATETATEFARLAVRLVRADSALTARCPATPTDDFEVGHETATHLPTGLMWKRCPEGSAVNAAGDACDVQGEVEDSRYSWQQALQHAEQQVFAGHGDWRVPNRKELQSIMEYCSRPRLNQEVFPDFSGLGSSVFWSSSPQTPQWNVSSSSWPVQFQSGRSYPAGRHSEHLIRLVRDAAP
ncbi:MAG: hypothetical protein C0462_12375 [Alcanivorax sp.]|nr:hypothetical protein [Alcanivorax sp.]